MFFVSPLTPPGGSDGKDRLQFRGPRFNPWVGKIPWRRAWQPTPVFLSGKSHGQRSLAGYNPWGHNESDITEQLITLILPPPSGNRHYDYFYCYLCF